MKNNYTPTCFKIYVDIRKFGVTKFIDAMSSFGYIILDDNMPIIFLKHDSTAEAVEGALGSIGLASCYREEITPEECADCDTFIKTWFLEKYNLETENWVKDNYPETLDRATQNYNWLDFIAKKLAERKEVSVDGN